METKLGIRKDSIEGRRINACIDFGLPLNILEVFGASLQQVRLENDESQEGYFIFQIAFLFIEQKQNRIAIFDRAKTKRDERERLTHGHGILCLTTPDLSGDVPFEKQILQKVSSIQIREVRVLGQGISHRGSNTYLLTVLEVTVSSETPITIKQSKDQFIEFVAYGDATNMLGEGREVDFSILKFLSEKSFDKEFFSPSAVDCWIQHNIILGVDIHRFSTYASYEQVLKYITLQVHIQTLLKELNLSAHTIQTGDGCFIVFSNGNEPDSLKFCLQLQSRISATNIGQTLLRYALHSGSVYKVLDLNHQVNFIGHGINYCARLLNVKEANVLYVSKDFRDAMNQFNLGKEWNFNHSHLPIKHQTEPDEVFFLNLK